MSNSYLLLNSTLHLTEWVTIFLKVTWIFRKYFTKKITFTFECFRKKNFSKGMEFEDINVAWLSEEKKLLETLTKKKHKDEILPFVSSPGCNCLDEKQETRSFFVFFNL